ncbi:type IV pilus modification protein PilV [Shewanella sp. GXUN23E]|uniref:type IV pilus modification protein PilV n=1 Tax=Shewanella sp. GXUN23E TaxID=3422498 RepID=UPI003D7E892A
MGRSHSGFSLIEVLVALIILTIGLIGIFNLHLVAKRGSYESFQQTQAAYLASDIISRMKLNRTELTSYAGTYTGGLSAPAVQCDVAVGGNVICDTSQTRLWDLYQWETLIRGETEMVADNNVGSLDNAQGCILVNPANGEVTVILSWRGIRTLRDSSGAVDRFGECSFSNSADAAKRRAYAVTTVII